MNKKTLIAIAGGLMTLVLMVSGFTGLKGVYAQASTPETPQTTQALPGRQYQYGDDALAAALNKTVEEVQAAQAAAFVKAVDQALADGAITVAQAEQLKTSSSNGYSWGALLRLAGTEEAAKLDKDAFFAEALGISADALAQARAKVETNRLGQLVAGGKLTQAQADEIAARQALMQSQTFLSDVKAGIKTALDNAVKAGTITQAQADALLTQLDSFNGMGMGLGGMRGGKGGGMGFFGGHGMFEQNGRGGKGMFDKGMFGGFGRNGQNAPTPTDDGVDG
ncbi:MAG: hypothetical protein VB108_07280 [Anaerolineaceae bacterium]|nr:hypothetical protein [Anaerolineaceae bacterium]